MPIYEYRAETSSGCDYCLSGFEELQRLSDATLTHCPRCRNAVRRVISAPHVAVGQSHVLREDHISRHGFTQYRRASKGVYEKTAGKGPDIISD